MPRSATYSHIYSITKEQKKIKGRFGGSKITEIKDFRGKERYDEDIAALKEVVEKYISLNANLSDSAKVSLRELKVTIGQTKEEVKLLLAEPLKIIQTQDNNYSASEAWVYKISKINLITVFIVPIAFTHEGYYLYFKDGALAGIERHFLEGMIQGTSPEKSVFDKK